MKLSTSNSSGTSSGHGERSSLTISQVRSARILFYSGWAVILLYLPSGVLHDALGSAVYFRDVLFATHLLSEIVWLVKAGEFRTFTKRHWLLVVPALFIPPALFAGGVYLVEGLTYLKWTAFWLDWVILGRLALIACKRMEQQVTILAGLTVILFGLDLAAGGYERISNNYLFSTGSEVSAFGVPQGKELTLANHIRVKGLQRDVFSYSNLMALSCVAGLLVFVSCQKTEYRLAAVGWSGAFGLGMLASGGRSSIIGVFGSAAVAGGLWLMPVPTRRWYGRIVIAFLLVALTFSALGVGQFAQSVDQNVMNGAGIGNANSAHERDANWQDLLGDIGDVPTILLAGGPLVSYFDARITPIFHFADNQYLWLLYHSGLLGFVAILLYFAIMLRKQPPGEGKTWVHDGLVLYLLFVMGEGIARESLQFLGCLPLFVACGYHDDLSKRTVSSAGGSSHGESSSRRQRLLKKPKSDASAFARRVRKAERREE